VDEALSQQIPHVYRLARRLSGRVDQAEEIVQETMLRAWKQRRQLNDPGALRVWVLKIAVNYWRDSLRARARVPGQDWPLTEPAARHPDAEQIVRDREELAQALAAMNSLPERQRVVLHLRACEELSIQEIADVLSITPEAVKASLSFARQRMREIMKEPQANRHREVRS
jgi:RNA polymerase sigma-70 factor (ECF subfamily)